MEQFEGLIIQFNHIVSLTHFQIIKLAHCSFGGLAQLARALALHARGHRFDSDILH